MARPRRLLLLALALLLAPAAAQADKVIALSFDDVPRDRGAFFTPDERTRWLIQALQRAQVRQAAFFVTPGLLEEPDGAGGEQRIAAYVAAGHVIANHSETHGALASSAAPAYLADVDSATAWLKPRPGWRPWFRFPYLDEGGTDIAKRDAIRQGLAARGLRNGYVTVDGSDWLIEDLCLRAQAEGKPINMRALRDFYVNTQVNAAEAGDAFARQMLGRSPAHVMLLHETDIAALFIADLVVQLRRLHWRVVPIDEAYADPLARMVPNPRSAVGTLLDQIADERRAEEPLWPRAMSRDTMRFEFDKQVIAANAAAAGAH